MATMDIFEGDAFTIVELTRALENIPFKPALLSGSNLFSPRGVRVPHRRDREPRRHAVADPVLRARLGLRAAGARPARDARLRLPPVQEAGRALGLGGAVGPGLRLGKRDAAGPDRGGLPAAQAPPGRRDHLRVPPAERHPGDREGPEGQRHRGELLHRVRHQPRRGDRLRPRQREPRLRRAQEALPGADRGCRGVDGRALGGRGAGARRMRLGLLRRSRGAQGGARDLSQHRRGGRSARPRRRRGQLRRHHLPPLPGRRRLRRADRQGLLLSRGHRGALRDLLRAGRHLRDGQHARPAALRPHHPRPGPRRMGAARDREQSAADLHPAAGAALARGGPDDRLRRRARRALRGRQHRRAMPSISRTVAFKSSSA